MNFSALTKHLKQPMQETRSERIKSIVDSSVPVTTTWNEDAILDFLLKQHELGNQEASDLLYLKLRTEVKKDVLGSDFKELTPQTKESIKGYILSYEKYPKEVVAELLRDFENDVVQFVPKQSSTDVDDMPF